MEKTFILVTQPVHGPWSSDAPSSVVVGHAMTGPDRMNSNSLLNIYFIPPTSSAAPTQLTSSNLQLLATFYKENSKIKVHYYFQNFDFDHNNSTPVLNFLTAGVALTTAVKGANAGKKAKDDLRGSQSWVRVLLDEVQHWRGIWCIEHLLKGVANFTNWPACSEQNTETSYPIASDAQALSASPALLRRWCPHIRNWTKKGISGGNKVW
jgi:hypothetical protein